MRRGLLCRGRLKIDSLNHGSSMTLGCKGKKHPAPHRLRMPWTEAREPLPRFMLLRRDQTLLDGSALLEDDAIDRMSQLDPLQVLQAAVAQRRYLTSTGETIFQLASQVEGDGRGQIFYRPEWKEGTYDKHITLSNIEFDRDGVGGTAFGFITFHGESSLHPIKIEGAEVPGWVMAFDESRKLKPFEIVSPPPSIGTEVPVNYKTYKLKAYPYYDPPNPPEFVERLMKDRGILPDPPGRDIPEGEERTESPDSSVPA